VLQDEDAGHRPEPQLDVWVRYITMRGDEIRGRPRLRVTLDEPCDFRPGVMAGSPSRSSVEDGRGTKSGCRGLPATRRAPMPALRHAISRGRAWRRGERPDPARPAAAPAIPRGSGLASAACCRGSELSSRPRHPGSRRGWRGRSRAELAPCTLLLLSGEAARSWSIRET
jgi:hypothetical protein